MKKKNMSFGDRLKYLREKYDYTQQEVADGIEANNNTISQYENNKRKPSLDMIKKLKDFFGVSYSLLIEGNKESSSIENIDPFKSDYYTILAQFKNLFDRTDVEESLKNRTYAMLTVVYKNLTD